MTPIDVVEKWVLAAEAKDAAGVMSLMSEQVMVFPPFQDAPVRGRQEVMDVFGFFIQSTDDFQYGRNWTSEDGIALEFFATIDGQLLHGIDLLHLDESGLIIRFDILGRPFTSVEKLKQAREEAAVQSGS